MSIETPLIRAHYRVIYPDPPWRYLKHVQEADGEIDKSVGYKTMSLDQLKALPIADLAHPDGCHLPLWTTSPFLEKAFDVAHSWGFKYSSSFKIWLKMKRKHGRAGRQTELVPLDDVHSEMHMGRGFTTRKNVEYCLLFRRGSPKRKSKAVREILISPVRENSRKPDEMYSEIEKYADGPYLELFARSQRPGWTSWGDESSKFGEVK